MTDRLLLQSNLERALVFCLAEMVGPVPLGAIQRDLALGTMCRAYAAGPAALAHHLDANVLDFIFGDAGAHAVSDEIARARRLGITILGDGCEGYPPILAQAAGRPAALFVRGEVGALTMEVAIAIVGTRKPTGVGKRAARRFAAELARAGACIVSGMAFGIDREAHLGAADGGGITVAVLASGVEKFTPAGNADVGRRILATGGAVVSEFPIGHRVTRSCFPRRNRVISSLARGVVVIEAPEKSGALSTARAALEESREVLAVPGGIECANSRGSNRLIRDGAALVESAAHVIESLGLAIRIAEPASTAGLPPQAAALVAALASGPATLDQIAASTGQPLAELMSAMVGLELSGRAIRDGARYALA